MARTKQEWNEVYYQDHKEELREKARKRRRDNKAWVNNVVNEICTKPCHYCGSQFDTAAMSVIYRPNVVRPQNLPRYKNNVYQWALNSGPDNVERERAKWIPICANCKLIHKK